MIRHALLWGFGEAASSQGDATLEILAAFRGMGLYKNFSLSERVKLQFRAEFFNALNRANFLDPVTGVSSAGFGSIKSANDPRIGQMALKLSF